MKKFFMCMVLLLSILIQNNSAFSQEQNIYCTAYINRLQDKVKSNWDSTHGQIDKKTVIIFKINRNGQIMGSEISEPSGDNEFDTLALYAIKNSEPFENFATNITDDDITISFIFSQNLIEATPISEIKETVEFSQKNKENNTKPLSLVNASTKSVKSKTRAKNISSKTCRTCKCDGTHGHNGKITPKSFGAGILSLIIWPGIGQIINGESPEKAGTHAILGLINVFRIWSCYDAIVDRQGGVWDNRI